MARIFKQTYSKPLPEESEIIIRKGQKLVKFRDSRGEIQTAVLSKSGKRIIRETAKWYIEYSDADGRVTKRTR